MSTGGGGIASSESLSRSLETIGSVPPLLTALKLALARCNFLLRRLLVMVLLFAGVYNSSDNPNYPGCGHDLHNFVSLPFRQRLVILVRCAQEQEGVGSTERTNFFEKKEGDVKAGRL